MLHKINKTPVFVHYNTHFNTKIMTAVEWLEKQLTDAPYIHFGDLFEQAKEMEKKKEYETKAYWFGRGILAGRENRIAELKPKQ